MKWATICLSLFSEYCNRRLASLLDLDICLLSAFLFWSVVCLFSFSVWIMLSSLYSNARDQNFSFRQNVKNGKHLLF